MPLKEIVFSSQLRGVWALLVASALRWAMGWLYEFGVQVLEWAQEDLEWALKSLYALGE